MPPWIPPHPGQPTSTGTIVGLPPEDVVIHVFAVHNEFVTFSVENPGGTVVIVEVIEFAVIVAETIGEVLSVNCDVTDTVVGRPSGPIAKVGKVKGAGIMTVEGGNGDFGITITPLYPEAHRDRQGHIGNIVGVVWPWSSVVVSDQVVRLGIKIKLVLNTNGTFPVIRVVSPAIVEVGKSTMRPPELAIITWLSTVNVSVLDAGIT